MNRIGQKNMINGSQKSRQPGTKATDVWQSLESNPRASIKADQKKVTNEARDLYGGRNQGQFTSLDRH